MAVDKFRAGFGGVVVEPADIGFDEALTRAIWNGDIKRRPALIARPTNAAEVADVLTYVRRESLDVTVRGGGHGYAGHAVADGAVMIDLGELNAVTVDPTALRVRCGGGATWADVDGATSPLGLAVTGGFISHTGVGGLALGGGFGWLTRQAGLTSDNLVCAEVVTADGRVVTASAVDNPDLFWALRGGGGNFGIVTRFEFNLHPVAPMANLALFFWQPDRAAAALRHARTPLAALPNDYGTFVAGMSAPPAPFVPAEFHGAPGFVVAVVNWGDAAEHTAAVAPFAALNPQWQVAMPIPYVALQQMFDESAPWGGYAYEKALYMRELRDDAIDILVEYLPRKTHPLSFLPIFPLGGAYAAVPEDATAFGGRRDTGWLINISAFAESTDALAAERSWVQDFWAALLPHSVAGGTYVNFLSDADSDRVRAAYGAEKYERLSAIKAVWDPDNVFHHNANISPAS